MRVLLFWRVCLSEWEETLLRLKKPKQNLKPFKSLSFAKGTAENTVKEDEGMSYISLYVCMYKNT